MYKITAIIVVKGDESKIYRIKGCLYSIGGKSYGTGYDKRIVYKNLIFKHLHMYILLHIILMNGGICLLKSVATLSANL